VEERRIFHGPRATVLPSVGDVGELPSSRWRRGVELFVLNMNTVGLLLTGMRHTAHAHEDKHLTYRLTRLRLVRGAFKPRSHSAWGQVRSIVFAEARAMHLMQDAHYHTSWAVGNCYAYVHVYRLEQGQLSLIHTRGGI